MSSASIAKARGDVGHGVREPGVVVLPRGAVPDLQAAAGAGDDDLLAESGVVEEEGRDADAPGGVELGVVGVGREEALQLLRLGREGMEALDAARTYASYSSGRHTATQPATRLASTTPSLSAERKRAGTVNRFFASSE
jgi:hypothetical protein